MQAVKKIVRKIVPRPIATPPAPVESEQSEYSAIASVYDEAGWASPRLIDLSLDAVERAMKDVHLPGTIWPGEEWCLLGGLMLAMRPKLVAIAGERTGRAVEVIEKYLPGGGSLSSESAGAEFILVSGPGDGNFEQGVLEQLARQSFQRPPIVMLNDTRRWEMLRFVREIRHPKLDMTSFARWTGTMLVEIAP